MRWGSLRLRLVAGGIVAILVALTIAGAGLTLLFERHVTRTIADDLDVHLKQLLAGIDIDAQGNLVMSRPPADPRFADPLVGTLLAGERRPRPVAALALALGHDLGPAGRRTAAGRIASSRKSSGPAKARLLVAERSVLLTVGDRRVPVRVAVAADLARVHGGRVRFRQGSGGRARPARSGAGDRHLDPGRAWACARSTRCAAASPISAPAGASICRHARAGRSPAAGRRGQCPARCPGTGDRALAQPRRRSRAWAEDAAGGARRPTQRACANAAKRTSRRTSRRSATP